METGKCEKMIVFLMLVLAFSQVLADALSTDSVTCYFVMFMPVVRITM